MPKVILDILTVRIDQTWTNTGYTDSLDIAILLPSPITITVTRVNYRLINDQTSPHISALDDIYGLIYSWRGQQVADPSCGQSHTSPLPWTPIGYLGGGVQ